MLGVMATRVWTSICLATVALALAPACATTSEEDGGTPEPRTGTWTYEDLGILDNTCGWDEPWTDPDTSFHLTNNGDGTFTIAQDTYGDFECTQSGSDFECPDRLAGDFPYPQYQVTLALDVSISGEIHSKTHITGVQRFDVECSGDGCAAAPALGITFPCYYTSEFDATAN
jgi:hypothetical protein